VAVFTGADLAKDNLGTMKMTLKRKRPDGSPMFAPAHRGLTQDRVRYVGDPIGLVIAETLAQAEDAAELVRVEYDPLPSVTSTAEAVGGPPGTNAPTMSPTSSRPATRRRRRRAWRARPTWCGGAT
jgi:CO/xanthine dehydrogenase Mo-binding subunit